jgi:hypothetical protein
MEIQIILTFQKEQHVRAYKRIAQETLSMIFIFHIDSFLCM